MDGCGDFGPGVVALSLVYNYMTATQRIDHQILATKLRRYCVLLPEDPILVFHMHGKHRRMVAHLQTHV